MNYPIAVVSTQEPYTILYLPNPFFPKLKSGSIPKKWNWTPVLLYAGSVPTAQL